MHVDDISGGVLDAAVGLHRQLGPGLLENVYETLLARRLQQQGYRVQRQVVVAFEFEGLRFERGLRVDMLVEDQIIIELKSVEKLAPVHTKQLLTYLKLMNLRVGLLLNFGAATMKEGTRRVVNGFPP